MFGASMLCLTACSTLKHDAPSVAHGVGDAIVGAAHDHVKVKLPNIPNPIDLGDFRLDALQAKIRSVFGSDETRENVDIACQAKDLLAQQSGTTAQAAVRMVLASLNITRPEDQVDELARIAQNALVASADPHAVGRAAVAWACEWAAG